MDKLLKKKVILIIGGGIAAYKSLDLIRLLKKQECEIKVVLTESGKNFVTPLSVASLSQNKVYQNIFDSEKEVEMDHISLSRWCDIILFAPITANSIAKLASGRADDLASTLILASNKQVILAPTMNVRMWLHKSTQNNIEKLLDYGYLSVGPTTGEMACGEYGEGKMSSPEQIFSFIKNYFTDRNIVKNKKLKAVVTAGSTREYIDPVRFITNNSSGKQGYKIASSLAKFGVETTLISGPSKLRNPENVKVVRVESADQMYTETIKTLPVDIAVCSAAICDFKPEKYETTKIKKIDRNAKIGIIFSKIINWTLNIKNRFLRTLIQLLTGIDKKVILPKYNSETFEKYSKKNLGQINSSAPGFGRKVVIYSTCFVNFNKKSTGIAALKVLKKNGVETQHSYPGCCGMPYFEQADLEQVIKQAKKVSKDLLTWIDKGYEVITLTASCGLMLKFEWPLLLPGDEKIKKLSKYTKDIDEYIVDIHQKEGLASGIQEIDGGVTVHQACHARAQNMGNKARDMLKLIPNIKIDLVEKCAGHGGTFGVMKKTHHIANRVGKIAAKTIKKNKYMASDCPLAGKHLKQLEQDTNITNNEAFHPIEILAKAYKLI